MLSIVVLASVLRNSSLLSLFREGESSKKFEYLINFTGVFLSLALAGTAVGLSVGRGGEDSFYLVLANACVLSFIGGGEILWHLFFTLSGFTFLFFVYLLYSIIRMDWRILLLQGRSLFVLLYYMTIVVFSATLTYLWDTLVDINEAECVALSPPENGPREDCEASSNVAYIGFVLCFISFYPTGVSIVSFLSTGFVWGWWKKLVTKRELNKHRFSEKMGRTT